MRAVDWLHFYTGIYRFMSADTPAMKEAEAERVRREFIRRENRLW
jgi:hypothetical protein